VRREWAERRARMLLSNAEHQRDVLGHRRELMRVGLHAALEAKDRATAEDLVKRIKQLDREWRSACAAVSSARASVMEMKA
jgi:hypothetical protein